MLIKKSNYSKCLMNSTISIMAVPPLPLEGKEARPLQALARSPGLEKRLLARSLRLG